MAGGVPERRARHGVFPTAVRGHGGPSPPPQPGTTVEVPPETSLPPCSGASLARCPRGTPTAVPRADRPSPAGRPPWVSSTLARCPPRAPGAGAVAVAARGAPLPVPPGAARSGQPVPKRCWRAAGEVPGQPPPGAAPPRLLGGAAKPGGLSAGAPAAPGAPRLAAAPRPVARPPPPWKPSRRRCRC